MYDGKGKTDDDFLEFYLSLSFLTFFVVSEPGLLVLRFLVETDYKPPDPQ